MTPAIGRLLDTNTREPLGTVFACNDRWVLTAFHCVGDRMTGRATYRSVLCLWDGDESTAQLSDFDTLNDVALLRLDRKLPSSIEPLILSPSIHERSKFTAPGAPEAASEVFNYALSGTVAWTKTRLEDGSTAIQLQSNESAALMPLQGLSGAPVIVGEPPRVGGLIRWNLPRADQPELAIGSAVFAAPASAILNRWPFLADSAKIRAATDIMRRVTERSSANRDLASDVRSLLLNLDMGLAGDDIQLLSGSERRLPAVFAIKGDLALLVVVPSIDASDDYSKIAQRFPMRSKKGREKGICILTDGVQWRLLRKSGENTRMVSGAAFEIASARPDSERLGAWLESILATVRSLGTSPREIEERLGARSPAYLLYKQELLELYRINKDMPYVRVRRDMWAKLLTTAAGEHFDDDDDLFVDHTLLALMAQVIGHAVLNFHPEDASVSAEDIVSGKAFARAAIAGVVEADFFDWVVRIPGGEVLVKEIARQLTRFAWGNVEHDVLKVLYHSIIPERVRHALGEYYTPDWLAEEVIEQSVTDSLNESVLDASCGSGTFLFHAVRKFVGAAQRVRMTPAEIISEVTRRVFGFDVHPVAVTLARVTYLLAIGIDNLLDEDRPAFAVPVYLCDSLRWGQRVSLWSYNGLSVRTQPKHSDLLYDPEFTNDCDFTDRLKFPDSVIEDSQKFDLFVSELAEKVTKSADGRAVSLEGLFRRFPMGGDDQDLLEQTFRNMIELHRQGRDHIWGYYVRNLARPVWMARPDNRVDVLVGNPPWLAYRWMTAIQKISFRSMSDERRLWAGSGSSVTTSQDLSALFVARCIELYLKVGGRFGYVVPRGTLEGPQYKGFRRGDFSVQTEDVRVQFARPWDLYLIKPKFFSQSVGVIFGKRVGGLDSPRPLQDTAEVWSGRFDTKTASRAEAAPSISRAIGEPRPSLRPSIYLERFFQGASVVPQVLFLVDHKGDPSPLGTSRGRRFVQSRRSKHPPWKTIDPIASSVERKFIYWLYLGQSILPYRCKRPEEIVAPWDGQEFLTPEEIDVYPGLSSWWDDAMRAWCEFRSNPRMSLLDQLNYRKKFTNQMPTSPIRVVIPKSAKYPAAAILSDPDSFVDQSLYWSNARSMEEARFLTAVLNSSTIQLAVAPLQSRGESNARDLCRHAFSFPIPLFDAGDEAHLQLVELSEQAEVVAANLELPKVKFELQRKSVRDALIVAGISAEIDSLVKVLLE
jgi:hypothetical protein